MKEAMIYIWLFAGAFVVMTSLFVITELEVRKLKKQIEQLKTKKKTKK